MKTKNFCMPCKIRKVAKIYNYKVGVYGIALLPKTCHTFFVINPEIKEVL